jgi:hypothetical protein
MCWPKPDPLDSFNEENLRTDFYSDLEGVEKGTMNKPTRNIKLTALGLAASALVYYFHEEIMSLFQQ